MMKTTARATRATQALVGALLIAGAFAAQAAEPSYYAGGAIGRGQHAQDCDPGQTCDDADTGFKLIGGWRLSKTLSVEAAYFDFGKATITQGPIKGELKSHAFGGGIAYRMEFAPQWSGILRVGLASVKTTRKITTLSDESDSSIQPYFGIGLGYALTPEVNLQASWDFSRGKVADDSGRIDLLSIGLTYDF